MELIEKICASLGDAVLKNITVYDLELSHPLFDYVVIASAANRRQVNSGFKKVKDGLPVDIDYHVEGNENDEWILVDLGNIIVHIMLEDERNYYQLDVLYYGFKKRVFSE